MNRSTYLKVMGIPLWRLKDRPLPALPMPISIELLHDVQRAAYLVLIGPRGTAKGMTLAQKNQLKERVKALGWSLKACAWAEWALQTVGEDTPFIEQLESLGVQALLCCGGTLEASSLPGIVQHHTNSICP